MDIKLKSLIIGYKMEILLKFQDKMFNIKFIFMDILKFKMEKQNGFQEKLLLHKHMIVLFQDMIL
jgi:hypothetical protein